MSIPTTLGIPSLSVKPPDKACPQTAPQRVSSETLLGARGELVILHNGREYRLRLTQSGKLILTA